MRRSRRCWPSLVVAVALLVPACRPSIETGDPRLLPTNDVSRPANTGEPDPPAPSSSAARPTPSISTDERGSLEFRVRDIDDRARPGIAVRYQGPVRGTAITDERGIARATVPAGAYKITIPVGCVEQLEIFRGGRAEAVVYPGTRSVVRLGGIQARAAIWLENPITFDADPPWRVGDRVTAAVTVVDRCRERTADAGTSVSWLRWRASPEIGLDGPTPTRSDRDGLIAIRFRCIRAGTASLAFSDPVTGETQDLLRIRRTFDVVEPTCG